MMRVVQRGPSVAMTHTRRSCSMQNSASQPGSTAAFQPYSHRPASQDACTAMMAG